MITKYNQSRPERITLISGPEGGFSPQEITQLQKAKFNGFWLTPTVLRASQAITLGSGVVRSILSDLKNS
jgi:RsmE family RNA methyltransferase